MDNPSENLSGGSSIYHASDRGSSHVRPERLQRLLDHSHVRLVWHDRVTSTNDAALNDDFHAPVTLHVAHFQTAGRGRNARSWVMRPGEGLAFTLSMPMMDMPPEDLQLLPLAVAIGVVETVAPERLRIKWPNDLFLDGRKLGGVLVETRRRGERGRLAIGVGLNLMRPPPNLEREAAALNELGRLDEPEVLLARLARSLQRLSPREKLAESWRSEWDFLYGRRIRATSGIEGKGCGLTRDGMYSVMTADGLCSLSWSDRILSW